MPLLPQSTLLPVGSLWHSFHVRCVHVTSGLIPCKVISSTTYIEFLSVSSLIFFAGSRAISNQEFERLLLLLFIILVCFWLPTLYVGFSESGCFWQKEGYVIFSVI